MSGRIAVIYTSDLGEIADVFADAAAHLASQVHTARLTEPDSVTDRAHPRADLSLIEWADGIAFGTPSSDGCPAVELMAFLEASEPLWRSGRLYDKAVTVFTDEPEHIAPDSILHPLYDALYRWGAVIVGPRHFELGWRNAAGDRQANSPEEPALAGARLRAAQHRAQRLTRLASVLAEEQYRRQRLHL